MATITLYSLPLKNPDERYALFAEYDADGLITELPAKAGKYITSITLDELNKKELVQDGTAWTLVEMDRRVKADSRLTVGLSLYVSKEEDELIDAKIRDDERIKDIDKRIEAAADNPELIAELKKQRGTLIAELKKPFIQNLPRPAFAGIALIDDPTDVKEIANSFFSIVEFGRSDKLLYPGTQNKIRVGRLMGSRVLGDHRKNVTTVMYPGSRGTGVKKYALFITQCKKDQPCAVKWSRFVLYDDIGIIHFEHRPDLLQRGYLAPESESGLSLRIMPKAEFMVFVPRKRGRYPATAQTQLLFDIMGFDPTDAAATTYGPESFEHFSVAMIPGDLKDYPDIYKNYFVSLGGTQPLGEARKLSLKSKPLKFKIGREYSTVATKFWTSRKEYRELTNPIDYVVLSVKMGAGSLSLFLRNLRLTDGH